MFLINRLFDLRTKEQLSGTVQRHHFDGSQSFIGVFHDLVRNTVQMFSKISEIKESSKVWENFPKIVNLFSSLHHSNSVHTRTKEVCKKHKINMG